MVMDVYLKCNENSLTVGYLHAVYIVIPENVYGKVTQHPVCFKTTVLVLWLVIL